MPKTLLSAIFCLLLFAGCGENRPAEREDASNNAEAASQATPQANKSSTNPTATDGPFLTVLGIAQDAGYPQAACQKDCCRDAWSDPSLRRHPVCLAIVEPSTNKRWMVECTPEFRAQLRMLDDIAPSQSSPGLDGILLTHAHIGHYAGLIHLGREVIGANAIPVYAMPQMKSFLEENGPWSQLVTLNNIALHTLENNEPVELSPGITATPLRVPHRDEYSETVAYVITGPNRRVLFLPDIDKWDKWDRAIEEVIASVDVAYVDGSFFDNDELPGRDMSEIPHPFVIESMERFDKLPAEERAKIRFIHFNHTNDALRPESEAAKTIRAAGYHIAEERERVEL